MRAMSYNETIIDGFTCEVHISSIFTIVSGQKQNKQEGQHIKKEPNFNQKCNIKIRLNAADYLQHFTAIDYKHTF